jgi:sporulation protein YlmC with PRC-barrel domain
MTGERPPILAITALEGYEVVGSDGKIGVVKDFLFRDDRWQVRWLVIDTGSGWLSGRKVLVHPSAVADVDHDRHEILTALTKQQVEDSLDLRNDQKLSTALEASLFAHYGWDPDWGRCFFATTSESLLAPQGAIGESIDDPHLRSFRVIKGYRLRATDGEIGGVENFLIDQAGWNIRYLIVSTGAWLMGKEVLLAPFAVLVIDWLNREILLNVTRDRVKNSPSWDPSQFIDESYEHRLHQHYGWPHYGF